MEEDLAHLRLTDAVEELQDLVMDHSDYLESDGPITFPKRDEATFVVQLSHWRRHEVLRYRVTITPEIPNLGNEEKKDADA